MSESSPINGFYNRITSLLSRIQSNISSFNISSIGLRRNGFNPSRMDSTLTRETSNESEDQRMSGSEVGTTGVERIRPPHSHLYRHRHSSHYPLLLGSYNWSLSRDNRFVTHLNNSITNREKDRNVLSAMLSIIVIATLATALAQPKWFSLSGGLCNRKYIGLQEFFFVGTFSNYHFNKDKTQMTLNSGLNSESDPLKETTTTLSSHEIVYYGMNGDLKNCVTPEIVTLQRTIIGLCFFAIMFNLIQFFMDTMGSDKKWLNAIRQHALGNILGVLLCVVIIGVSYLVSNLLEKEQRRLIKVKQSSQESHHIEVKFELSYYLVTLSGLLAIIAAASNLLKRPQHYYIDASDSFWSEDIDASSSPFDDEMTSSATTSPIWNSNTTRSMSLTIPPPPYSP